MPLACRTYHECPALEAMWWAAQPISVHTKVCCNVQLLETELLVHETARMHARVQSLSGPTVQMSSIRAAAAAATSALDFLEVSHQSHHAHPSERTSNEAQEGAEELRLCALRLAELASRFNVRSIQHSLRQSHLDSPAADMTSLPI